jgi:hypothetical protein
MSSQTVKKKAQIFLIYDTDLENSINFNKIIIPFSDLGKTKSPSFIYEGDEGINFKERHPIYKKLLLDEFVD